MLKKTGAYFGILFLSLLLISIYFVSGMVKTQHKVSVLSEVQNVTATVSNNALFNDRLISWDVWKQVYVPLIVDNEIAWREIKPEKISIILTSSPQIHDIFADKNGPVNGNSLQSLGFSIKDNKELQIYVQMNMEKLKENDKRDNAFEIALFRGVYYITHKGIDFSEINQYSSAYSKELREKGPALHVSFN